MDRRMLCRIAKECDALYKVNSVTLIEMDTFEAYFKEKYLVKGDEE
jgi:hypothetical protein